MSINEEATEIWEPIKDYEDLYSISNRGRVKSLRTRGGVKDRILKNSISCYGYHKVKLCKEGSNNQYFVHRLIAIAFILNPKNKQLINHLDGDKLNNSINNLKWCTNKENMIHAVEIGLIDSSTTGMAKLSYALADKIREMYNEGGYTHRSLAKVFSVKHNAIGCILRGQTWVKK